MLTTIIDLLEISIFSIYDIILKYFLLKFTAYCQLMSYDNISFKVSILTIINLNFYSLTFIQFLHYKMQHVTQYRKYVASQLLHSNSFHCRNQRTKKLLFPENFQSHFLFNATSRRKVSNFCYELQSNNPKLQLRPKLNLCSCQRLRTSNFRPGQIEISYKRLRSLYI